MLLGCHESIAGGVHRALYRGRDHGAACVQVFVKSSNRWAVPQTDPAETEALVKAKLETGIEIVCAHAGYLINLAQPTEEGFERSRASLEAEVDRAGRLGIRLYVVHPGSHLATGVEAGIARAAEALASVLPVAERYGVDILLENTAGQGSCLGGSFDELDAIIRSAGGHPRLGVCLDSAHAFESGLFEPTREGTVSLLSAVLEGMPGRLRAIHLNDSATPAGSRRDRHARIGEGQMGLDPFRALVTDPRLREVPGFLETPPYPSGEAAFSDELKLLRSLSADGPASP